MRMQTEEAQTSNRSIAKEKKRYVFAPLRFFIAKKDSQMVVARVYELKPPKDEGQISEACTGVRPLSEWQGCGKDERRDQ